VHSISASVVAIGKDIYESLGSAAGGGDVVEVAVSQQSQEKLTQPMTDED
jgi:hypothetical protein